MRKAKYAPYVHQFPAPVVLIGCGEFEQPNLITCAWFGVVCSEPPQVAVSIRPDRHSFGLISETGEFTVNLPTAAQIPIVKHCGSRSGRDENKFETLELVAEPCPPLKHAPMLAQSRISLACEVRHRVELGTHTQFVGEVLAVHAEPSLGRPSGRVDPIADEQLVYLDGRYWQLQPAE